MDKSQYFGAILETSHGKYQYFSLKKAETTISDNIAKLPFTLKILLENLLRYQDNKTITLDDIKKLATWSKTNSSNSEILYRPARVLMQDFTGVPAIVDLAAMREAIKKLGGNPEKINPLSAVDLVIDHSVQVDSYGNNKSFQQNVSMEFKRNKERYQFLKWGQKAFTNFRVVPPGTGICHQVNLEFLSHVICSKKEKNTKVAYPDTLVGTDSHTTMINGLAVLGWGVGGIEAEAAMLGQPISMLIPEVIGFKLHGYLKEGVTATDLVLTVTHLLRQKGVVGKFVEFYGDGLESLSLADRATIANMAPEYGATCGFFPVDQETINYLKLTGRSRENIELVEKYTKAQGLWRDNKSQDPVFTDTIKLDLAQVEPCLAGPKRPQDQIMLSLAKKSFAKDLKKVFASQEGVDKKHKVKNSNYKIGNGDIVIAAITSCTNTSNPVVMLAAGLIAQKAIEKGMSVKPWVKTSLAPGSKVVSEYLEKTELQKPLDKLGFNLVGYGCTTCIGNSGPLDKNIADTITKNNLVVASVLSGNRNFEGRIHPLTKANYLASPPLVVLYALAGSINTDLTKEPIGQDKNGQDVFLKDLWPTNDKIKEYISSFITPEIFKKKYQDVFSGEQMWQKMKVVNNKTYKWDKKSTYINKPPYFVGMKTQYSKIEDINAANIIAMFGDSITTDHISPAGVIALNTPAAKYLESQGIDSINFNSYGSRRGNHEVMIRGTFANTRIKNEITPDIEGGITIHYPTNKQMSIYDAAIKYYAKNIPLVVIAGKEYGTGSSRDWAAKGTKLLGIRAVIAESFERIHRSNLIGMGVIPFVFKDTDRKKLKLQGNEIINITGLSQLQPNKGINCNIKYQHGNEKNIQIIPMIYTLNELYQIENGGILHMVIRDLVSTH